MTSTWRWSGAHRFEHEAQPEHVAEGGHETRPLQAELEAEDRTRDDADREQREHHLRPAPRERAEERVAGARHSANRTIAGNAMPKQTRGMCTANESAC